MKLEKILPKNSKRSEIALKIYNKYCDSIIRITKKLEQENKLLENQKKLYLAKFF